MDPTAMNTGMPGVYMVLGFTALGFLCILRGLLK